MISVSNMVPFRYSSLLITFIQTWWINSRFMLYWSLLGNVCKNHRPMEFGPANLGGTARLSKSGPNAIQYHFLLQCDHFAAPKQQLRRHEPCSGNYTPECFPCGNPKSKFLSKSISALSQMLLRHCHSCWASQPTEDLCKCVGETTLTRSSCPHCERLSLTVLQA